MPSAISPVRFDFRFIYGLLAGILFFLLCLLPSARADETKRPRIILILCEGLTLDDIHLGNNANPHLAFLAEHGAVGLMNCATANPKSDTAATLALAAGKLAPAEKTDEMAANDWEKVPNETVGAEESYRRRMGYPELKTPTYDPDHTVKHLGIRSLQERGLDSARLGAVLAAAHPPVRCWVVGNADTERWKRRAALLTVDAAGRGAGLVALRSYDEKRPYGLTDSPPALADYAFKSHADFVVIQMGDGARAEAARAKLSDAEYRDAHDHAMRLLNLLVFFLTAKLKAETRPADILLVAPRPPSADAEHKDNWNHLTPLIAYGPDFPPGTFTSPTTRTPGIIANIDLTPTLLTFYGLPIPPTMTGRPMQILPGQKPGLGSDLRDVSPASKRLARISRLDFMATLNDAGLAITLLILGVIIVGFCFAGIIAVSMGQIRVARLFAMGLIFALNFPGALLFAPVLVPPTLSEYILRIGFWMLVLTVVCYGFSRLFRVSLPVIACMLNVLLILADTMSGQHLLKDALISNYYLPGFRYYGIGNDFLGVLLGCSLAAGFSLVDDLSADRQTTDTDDRLSDQSGRPLLRALISIAWALVAVVLVAPWWGANAGSIIAASAGFGVGAWLLWSKRHSWPAWIAISIVCTLLGIALSFGFAALDARMNGSLSAHAGLALRTAMAGSGARYLGEIIWRKLLLNLSLLASPWIWLTTCLLIATMIIATMLAETQLDALDRRRPWLALMWRAVGAALVASVLFKDTGVVTACYLIGVVMVVRFYYLLRV